jgi:hypothetical protein
MTDRWRASPRVAARRAALEYEQMTDIQLYLGIGAPVIAIMIGMMFNHTRINDMRDLLRAEIQTSREQTRSDFNELKSMIQVLMSKMDEFDTRLTRVEERLAR